MLKFCNKIVPKSPRQLEHVNESTFIEAPSPTSSPLPVSPTAASPVAVELSLDDPDPAEIVQQPNQLTFTIIDDATLKRKRKLVDNDGYTYNVKRQCVGATHSQCTVRPKVNIFFP